LRTQRLASPADPAPSTDGSPPEALRAFIERVAPKHCPIPWHLLQLVELFDRAMRERVHAIVSMPPRHAKTTTVRRALAYAIKTYPDRLNALGMYAESSAKHQSRQIRKLVRAEGVALEPDAQTVGLWLTPQEGGLFAAGASGQWTGKGINGLLVLDDVIKGREPAESPAIREKVWETITDDIYTRIEPPCGSVIVVMTRWHEDDPAGRFMALGGKGDFPPFEVINLPALRDPATGEPSDEADALALWPDRFPREQLVRTRAVLGAYGWGSLYQGSPRPKGGKVFKRDPGRFDKHDPAGWRVILSLDGAGTEDTAADYTVCLALAVRGSGDQQECRVLDMLRMQLEPQDSARLLRPFVDRHGGGELVIEATRDGRAIDKALRAIDSRFRTRLIPPIGDKYTRAQPVAAAWNADAPRVAIPADASAHPWVKDFLDEARKFTGMGDKHDDCVDALSQGWNAAAEPRRTASEEHYHL
jgi:predicted phage terminase large subunit-like protein